MTPIVTSPATIDQRKRNEEDLHTLRPSMVKVQLKNARERDFRSEIGRVLQRACSLVGWSQKELAGRLSRDTAQVARWMAGTERPQFDVLFEVEELRQPLVLAFAALAEDVEIVTEIRLRRIA